MDEFKDFEKQLESAFAQIDEIDLSAGQKIKIASAARTSLRLRRFVLSGVVIFSTFATAACLIFIFQKSESENFSLDDIIIAREAADYSTPTHQQSLWFKALQSDMDLSAQEEFAIAYVADDFSQSAQNRNEPLRKLKLEKSSIVMFQFFKSSELR